MLDFKFSWQETKGFNPDQSRSADGRFGSGAGRSLVGQIYLDAQKVAGHHKITVHNSRVRKYAGHDTVESFVAGHKRGRAAAMRELTTDHATGKVSFSHPETGETPAAAKPKVKPGTVDHSAAKVEAGRSLRDSFLAKPGASLKPIARDPKRSDVATLEAAHGRIAASGDPARLSHVRTVLGNYARPEQDRMLHGALMGGHASGSSLSQISDAKSLDAVEKTAAYAPAGDPFHLLRVTHRGRKSTEIDDVDGTDVSAVTDEDLRDLFDDALLASAGLT